MPTQSYSLELRKLRFPRDLAKKRSNFRLVVNVRYFSSRGEPQSESRAFPDLEEFWECDSGRSSRPNYVRGEDEGDFGCVDLERVDGWDKTALLSAADLRAVRVTLYDVDRMGLWEKVLDQFESVVEAVAGKAAGYLPTGLGFSQAVEELLVEKLSAGDNSGSLILFRQTWIRDEGRQVPRTLDFAGDGHPYRRSTGASRGARSGLRRYEVQLGLDRIEPG